MTDLGLSAMDGLEEGLLDEMQDALEINFPLRIVRSAPVSLSGVEWDRTRRQHSAPLVLQRVLSARDRHPTKLLAVTGNDLFIPMLTFVYGQAQLSGRAAVVSIARLRQQFYGLPPNLELLIARGRKEAVHETGHLFGLVHCAHVECAMSLSTNLRQIDLKNDLLCPACRARVWEG